MLDRSLAFLLRQRHLRLPPIDQEMTARQRLRLRWALWCSRT